MNVIYSNKLFSDMQPDVSVIVLTYNQKEWIKTNLDCILSQKTHFSFEIIIGDDNSTDGTREICREYADNYSNVHLMERTINIGAVPNWCDCIKHCNGKYLMMCDGDDFWHNDSKIQLQTDFMENHPNCVISHTDKDTLDVRTNKIKHNLNAGHYNVIEGNVQTAIVEGRDGIATSSICMRMDMIKKYIPLDMYINENFPCVDWPTFVILSAYGEVRYIPISTFTYRFGHESISHSTMYDRIRSYYLRGAHMHEVLFKLFPNQTKLLLDKDSVNNEINHALLMAAYKKNDYNNAHKLASESKNSRISTKMAKSRLTFIIYRFYKKFIYK